MKISFSSLSSATYVSAPPLRWNVRRGIVTKPRIILTDEAEIGARLLQLINGAGFLDVRHGPHVCAVCGRCKGRYYTSRLREHNAVIFHQKLIRLARREAPSSFIILQYNSSVVRIPLTVFLLLHWDHFRHKAILCDWKKTNCCN